MVDPETRVALPAAGSIIPESIEFGIGGVKGAQRVGPTLRQQAPPLGPRFGLEQGVMLGGLDRKDVAILWNDVEVARQQHRALQGKEFGRMSAKPLHPSKL